MPNSAMTSASAFQQLLLDLNPRDEDKKRVGPLANEIRETLRKSKHFGGVSRDILAGSARRGTAIHPLHDVDLFLILDPKIHAPPEKERSPELVLSHLSTALNAEFGRRGRVKVQHRSLNLKFWDEPVAFDGVPAFPHPTRKETFWIPDLSRKDWIFTNPEKHHAALKAADKLAGSKLNPLIRVMKHWNHLAGRQYPSFYLEVMCYSAFKLGPDGFASGFQAQCTHLAGKVLERCSDPAGVGPRIDDGASPEVRQTRALVFQDLARRAANAFAFEKQKDLPAAHAEWRQIFGSSWPA